MLFKILHGEESNISIDITPFHEGWGYMTHSGNFYCDLNIGTIESPNNQRIQLNAANCETLCGLSLDELRAEFATQNAVVLHEAQLYTDAALELATTQDAVVLHEAQVYTDSQINNIIARLEVLEKIIANSPLVDNVNGFGTLDAGTVLDTNDPDVTNIDPDAII